MKIALVALALLDCTQAKADELPVVVDYEYAADRCRCETAADHDMDRYFEKDDSISKSVCSNPDGIAAAPDCRIQLCRCQQYLDTALGPTGWVRSCPGDH